MSDELCDLRAADMSALIRGGKISATELLEHHIDRIERRNPDINAFTTLCLDAARQAADQLDLEGARGDWRGPLHGLPYAVKDTFDVKGLPTTFGSAALAENLADSDAIHVSRLRAAGAVIIGKTNLPEFALGCQTTNKLVGSTRNPLDPAKSVSGSSGGAAAALAAGMTALADGSDLGGSARSPAAWTGTVGLRPSSGTIPWKAGAAMPVELHVPAPMARTVADLSMMYNVMQGAHPDMPRSWSPARSHAQSDEPAIPPLRLAWSLTPCGAKTDPEIARALSGALQTIRRQGHDLEEFCPDIGGMTRAQDVFRRLNSLMEAGPAIDGRELQFARPVSKAVLAGKALSSEDIARALRIQAASWEKLTRAFEAFDFLLWPTTTGQAYSADLAEDAIDADWTPCTLTPGLGIPALSLPVGRLGDGMPVGLQILGPRGSDFRLIEFARALETVCFDL